MLARGEKNVRSPILVQVEEQGERQNCLGRARNISLSGVLMETPDTLAEGAGVIIRFFVPPDHSPIETAGRVVESEPGSFMAIAFLGLPESQRESLLAYLKTVDSTGFPEPVPTTDDAEPGGVAGMATCANPTAVNSPPRTPVVTRAVSTSGLASAVADCSGRTRTRAP